MLFMHDYYNYTYNTDIRPSWIKCEGYQNCEHFSKFFSFFTK